MTNNQTKGIKASSTKEQTIDQLPNKGRQSKQYGTNKRHTTKQRALKQAVQKNKQATNGQTKGIKASNTTEQTSNK